jgi:hypothetical protein
MVEAEELAGGAYWSSPPDSGYSVDNLAPPAPAPFTGEFADGVATLHWGVSPAPDFAAFRLYRGNSPDFVPGPDNLVTARADTGYVDHGGRAFLYKLAAVDVHGNEGPCAFLQPAGTVDVPDGAPVAFALQAVYPNPSVGGRLSVTFSLATADRARLELLDVRGRQVQSREVGALGAGRHAVDLTEGRRLTAGLYLVRLTQGGRARVARVVVLE